MGRQADARRSGSRPIDASLLGLDHGDLRLLGCVAGAAHLWDGFTRPLHPAHRRAHLLCYADAHATDALLNAGNHGHRICEASAREGPFGIGDRVAAWGPECALTPAHVLWAHARLCDNGGGARGDGFFVSRAWP